jgi:hypothetical protein
LVWELVGEKLVAKFLGGMSAKFLDSEIANLIGKRPAR